MKLSEYEDLIRSLVEVNKNDDQIYINLQKMIKMFLQRKKVCDCQKDYEDLSFTISADIFMDIINGLEIVNYLGYLEKIYRQYAHTYYQDKRRRIVESVDLSSINHGDPLFGEPTSRMFSEVSNKIYLEKISSVIDRAMEASCKYNKRSSSYLNLKLSLILSLIRNSITSYHLTPEQESYLKLICVNFRSIVIEDGLGFIENY